jgi:hypothetical protein
LGVIGMTGSGGRQTVSDATYQEGREDARPGGAEFQVGLSAACGEG